MNTSKSDIVNISVIIPTLNRAHVLNNTIDSISRQNIQPFEIIIIDGSSNFEKLSKSDFIGLRSDIIHHQATELGAAKQRNQGIILARTSIIGFFDDDILLEKDCIANLYTGLQENPSCGGINAVITNQSYHSLGRISKLFYRMMGADTSQSLAGKCIGPAINFLTDSVAKDDFTSVDWLNTGCTLYRKEALPNPVFDKHFTGYSLMEDLALSLRVAKNWKLLNSTNSRIYHDSQPSEGKDNIMINAEMELVNRFYIMKHILNKNNLKDYFQLFLQQLFGGITSKKILSIKYLKGKISALKKIKSI